MKYSFYLESYIGRPLPYPRIPEILSIKEFNNSSYLSSFQVQFNMIMEKDMFSEEQIVGQKDVMKVYYSHFI